VLAHSGRDEQETTTSIAREAAVEAANVFRDFADNAEALGRVADAGALLAKCLESDGKVITCGNGGSMCDAMHLAEELSGRFRADRRALGALALSDASHLTCVGNDMGYDEVFARAVEALGRPGDVLVVFTTSGTSRNVLRATSAARQRGMQVVAVTGHAGTAVEQDATITIVTPGGRWADRVQELHSLVVHTLIEVVERLLGLETVP
jgi:D-sedoheptulose 7-phosphate isomerase